jgi:hypothetical protein
LQTVMDKTSWIVASFTTGLKFHENPPLAANDNL